MNNNNTTTDLLQVFIDTMLYEQTNKVTIEGQIIFEDDKNKQYKYIHHTPPTLPKYLEDFSYSDKNNNQIPRIVEGPELCECVGPTRESSHIVMKNKGGGVSKCHSCNGFVCSTCKTKSDDTGHTLCLPCYAAKKMTPFDLDENTNQPNQNGTSINSMKKVLEENGLELEASGLPHEIKKFMICTLQKKH